jgi:DNA-binding CsgD family transcriptional regulator/tetratricopeptide (TPR) repeat protein
LVAPLGRRAERDTVERLLVDARAGRSGALVIRGEAGIGKSALLEHARDTAVTSGFRVENVFGVESETQLGFAGLHQLCGPLLDRTGALPDPQQTALGVAFGLRGGAAPDRFLVALATLSLLAEIAEESPLLCLVDDAQWLDQASAQALAFVARRLAAEQVALVFAVRDPCDRDLSMFTGLPELRVDGLADHDARTLLDTTVRAPLDSRVRDRIVAEARGNPLALLELPRNVQLTQLAGGFALPDAPGVPRVVEDSFLRRSGELPAETQMLLLVAAAEPTGEAELLWRALDQLGIAADSAEPAELAGLLEIDTHVRFHHPLVRSAVYRAAAPPELRRAHAALAAATDPTGDPDRRAWHRAQAVLGHDESVAAELELSADRARARGGVAAAAAFLEHATRLTPDPVRRAERALAAAYAKREAGAYDDARDLLAVASDGPLDELQRARVELLSARVSFDATRGSDLPGKLLDAAKSLAPLDPVVSRETYLHAIDLAGITGGLGDDGDMGAVAEAAMLAPPPIDEPGLADLLFGGLVTMYAHGYAAGVPELRRAVEAFCSDEPPAGATAETDGRRWLYLASRASLVLFDDEALYQLSHRNVRLAREAGALGALPMSMMFLAAASTLAGEPSRAAELLSEEAAISESTGGVSLRFGRLHVAAWRGHQAEAVELHAASVEEATARGNDAEIGLAHGALAVLHNGLGNYVAALEAAERSNSVVVPLPHTSLALPEFVEAASRAGEPKRAAVALDELASRAQATGTTWALGLEAQGRALTSTGSIAEDHHRHAIDLLGACRMSAYLARAHLVYGEWLRREGRRQDARSELRRAHELLTDAGLEAFAARAARELRATGEHPRKRTAQPSDALTPHEVQIARLVATGATSREVGAQLFLSPRTIEAHLRSIFRKLDITSRRQLRDLPLP